jgi:Fe2+ transport system protein FeoA
LLQLSFKSTEATPGSRRAVSHRTLVHLNEGEQGILDHLELPDDMARRLMELGFIPGSPITAARSAPGGDPKVFRVDGSEIALRKETAACLRLRPEAASLPHEIS